MKLSYLETCSVLSYIDQKKIDLVGRMGGNWYCRANGESLFEVQKPLTTMGIGVDNIPEDTTMYPYSPISIQSIRILRRKAFDTRAAKITHYFKEAMIFMEFSPKEFDVWLPESQILKRLSVQDKFDIDEELMNQLIMQETFPVITNNNENKKGNAK